MNVQNSVCNFFNKYFVKAAGSIGQPDTLLEGCTLEMFLRNIMTELRSELRHVSEQEVLKLNVKKAPGCDNIPPKILKIDVYVLARLITFLINQSVDTKTG